MTQKKEYEGTVEEVKSAVESANEGVTIKVNTGK